MTNQTPLIPFFNLHKINSKYHERLKDRFSDFLDSGIYIKGSAVEKFENAYADFCGVTYCIGTGNGLDALTIILKAYIVLGDVNPGDEVLVAANTFIATIFSIKEAGLTPVFVEPNEETYTIDIHKIEAHISERTKVILPTHLYGQLASITEIKSIAMRHNLLVISDAAQAHGAKDKNGNVAGSLCDASSFSFYPSKNLGAFGDAGAVTTNNKELADVVRSLGNYGSSYKYRHDHYGVNSRLDELQAIFLLEKLKDLEKDNIRRIEIAKKYLATIKNDKILLPNWDGASTHVFHLFVVRVSNRTHFCDYLEKSGIGFLIHYPIAPHHQKALPDYVDLPLPITEKIHQEVVSIPLNIGLEDYEIDQIINNLNQY